MHADTKSHSRNNKISNIAYTVEQKLSRKSAAMSTQDRKPLQKKERKIKGTELYDYQQYPKYHSHRTGRT